MIPTYPDEAQLRVDRFEREQIAHDAFSAGVEYIRAWMGPAWAESAGFPPDGDIAEAAQRYAEGL